MIEFTSSTTFQLLGFLFGGCGLIVLTYLLRVVKEARSKKKAAKSRSTNGNPSSSFDLSLIDDNDVEDWRNQKSLLLSSLERIDTESERDTTIQALKNNNLDTVEKLLKKSYRKHLSDTKKAHF